MKKKMVHTRLLIIGVVLLVLLVAYIIVPRLWSFTTDPILLGSKETVRDSLFELTPMGTSMDDVLAMIENNEGWRIRHTFNRGFPHPYTQEVIGEKTIMAYIGHYRNRHGIFIWYVTAFWWFDEDANLIDIFVLKEADA